MRKRQSNYDKLEWKTLFELYGSLKTITEVERNLLEAKQGKDESVDAYAARIRRLSITYFLFALAKFFALKISPLLLLSLLIQGDQKILRCQIILFVLKMYHFCAFR